MCYCSFGHIKPLFIMPCKYEYMHEKEWEVSDLFDCDEIIQVRRYLLYTYVATKRIAASFIKQMRPWVMNFTFYFLEYPCVIQTPFVVLSLVHWTHFHLPSHSPVQCNNIIIQKIIPLTFLMRSLHEALHWVKILICCWFANRNT